MKGVPRLFWFLLLFWAIAFAGSFIAFVWTEPSGSGFTRGTNRLGAFLGWQALAIGLAVMLWWRARSEKLPRPATWLMKAPAAVALVMMSMLLVLIGWAVLSDPR